MPLDRSHYFRAPEPRPIRPPKFRHATKSMPDACAPVDGAEGTNTALERSV
jgi:hypothetical protein